MFAMYYLIFLLFNVAVNSNSLYGSVLTIGVMAHIAIQSIINIAVTVNLFPNTGITLPFISAGGTSIFTLLIQIGVVVSVDRHSALGEFLIKDRRRD